jgi:hypothetical protein
MKIKLFILSLLCLSLINAHTIPEFETFRNKTNIKQIASLQLATTNAELNQHEVSLDYTKDKKDVDVADKTTLVQTSISAIISTSIRSTLKNRNLISKGYFDELVKLVMKDVGSSLIMKSAFWFIPKKFKSVSQLSMFVLTNSYICYGKSAMKTLNHLVREVLKLIGYIVLLAMIQNFSKRFVVRAIYFGFLSFFWDYVVKNMTDSMFGFII